MTKRDFFRIIIKLFGLYSLILTVFNYIPSNIGYVTYDFEPLTLLWILGATAIVVLIYIFLILKTDRIIDLLKIDKGFDDERIEIGNFNSDKILKFALIIIGGFLIIDFLPNFLHYTFLAFKSQVSPKGLNYLEEIGFGKPSDYFNWTVSTINIIIGIILLTNYDRISKWLIRKEKTVGNTA
ncbi:hypothetical protein DFR65_11211 [Oceanihabitans sediminis]|jgi:hypothetical protein|uniref:Uncharacterized protein n=1 Tax=Oceanihabitans sediminis TaxID=1812012 RepID=A0A368P0L3_9FLAO|nr:hypothetical protein [Oceanihabitans sediminis]RBP27033.1 hypothetical protein DFR65_11211 [Oceanihabitans sediminis]RCU56387.1 hypothetical protein DU428_13070 [Oceanihabitans sediminis]|tara:strand:- start:323 stop:868 length:546 start_codon:yes stop_codon:yes gene_type:complete